MARTLVIVGARPLIGLAATIALGPLRRLFGRVTVAAVVRGAVCAGGSRRGAAKSGAMIEAAWILEFGVADATGRTVRRSQPFAS